VRSEAAHFSPLACAAYTQLPNTPVDAAHPTAKVALL